MRRALAIRHVMKIAAKLDACGGMIQTPKCGRARVKVTAVYLFGSVLTDKPDPKDVDLEIEMEGIGRWRRPPTVPYCKRFYRSIGVKVAVCEIETAMRIIRAGMQMVRLSAPRNVGIASSQRRMIWPAMEFDPEQPLPAAKRHEVSAHGALIPHEQTTPDAITRSRRWA